MKLPIQYRMLFRLTLLVIIILFYDQLWEFIAHGLHLLLELSHQLFEVVEEGLDILVEFLFDTGGHTTQIIVFYILLAIILYVAYKFLRNIPINICRCKDSFFLYWLNEKEEAIVFYEQQKAELANKWQTQPVNQKLKVIAAGLVVFSGVIVWLFFL